MADYLKNFAENEVIKASDTNSNNQYLLDRINNNYTLLKTWLDGETGRINSNIQSGDATLQAALDKLEESINERFNSRIFTEKTLAVKVGTIDLSTYLPEDNQQYLVFINAKRQSNSGTLTAKTDVMTVARTLYQMDSDYGRTSAAAILATVPVGSGRELVLSGVADWINLCGYIKI
ncbi:MAG: hypothetical protein NC408_04515 [Candidatus Gastranaerophilales bacterium]|nr:hypothetical protein [Candidatus Gastranaerophilales bacterium]MCM1072265.1 hypothetical protein [Bacteroides sp.]